MTTAGRSAWAAFMVVVMAAGLFALGYARWTRPIAQADEALAAGNWDAALAAYSTAEARFDRTPFVKQLVPAEYNRVVANELWLLYRLRRDDEVMDRAERAPEGAAPHFWSGLSAFAKARAETKPEAQLGWLTRSEEELRRAVEAAPADWDTKYNFELVTRLANELRKQPKTPPKQLMQLLRPQPKPGTRPERRVG